MSFELPVVVVDEATNARLVPISIFAEGKGFAHQIRAALPERVVEAFDMGRLTSFLAYRSIAFSWKHLGIGLPEITIADRPFAVIGWERLPQLATGLGGAITKG